MTIFGDDPVYACPTCLDRRWQLATNATELAGETWQPCPDCNPIVHRRWRAGHYRANHSCPECAGIAAGKITTAELTRSAR